ncbi:hypothetical protein BYI23_B008220 [Burkholderia sp. YI23]|nr:hypothetical protein BYI23_B008220 [Burkholderia sp. YI23]
MAAVSSLLRRWLARQRFRVRRAVIGRIPARMLEPISEANWIIGGVFNIRSRANGVTRAEIGRDVLGLPRAQVLRSRRAQQLEKLIDQRIYFGRAIRGGESWPDLEAIAQTLAARITNLRREYPGRPVFLSPFHFVSQYANIYVVERVGALLGIASLAVVSGVPRNQYGDDHALIPGINVLYTYGDANRHGLGVRVARSLKRDGVAVLFSDVPPASMHRYPMETVDVSMFGKNARIHNGVFRTGAKFDALLLPFFLRFADGRFEAKILDCIALGAEGAPQQLAGYIQSALLDNYEQWLPAGHPAMYAFAPAR